jgi:pimeloyl-ACP methyl ester carboxylesterase
MVKKRRQPSNEAAAPAQAKAHALPASKPPAAYAPVLNAGFQATTARVQDMHQAISGQTFDHLLRMPGLAGPTRLVQGLHDAIAQGVYAAVRHGGGAALALASHAERLATDPDRVPGAREQTARSALNGVFGDSLMDAGSALAIRMGLHAEGAPLAVTPEALQALRPRVCVFVHGLACDERSWALRSEAWQGSAWAKVLTDAKPPQYGALLERECDVSAVYLRYNTGLAIDNNAQQLGLLLARAAAVAPQVREWVLIGHSMGGLVARRAHALATVVGERWAAATTMIVCLGSPHQGAPLEKAGQLAAAALSVSNITQPLARIANARSRGIKDLRHGLKGQPRAASPALRMVFATLGDASEAGALFGKLFGDGLVMPGSAGDVGLAGDIERIELDGLGHMGLLNHPRVYAVLRRWLGAPELSPASVAAPRG